MNDTAISRDTFQDEDILNKLKHYVGVRLQQGVPLVDADWNEQEDIHKFELQAFLKWFVGNGVPKGNDGFKLEHLEGHIVISTINNSLIKSRLEILLQHSPAAEILGFDQDNSYAERMGPLPAQLTSKNYRLGDDKYHFGSTKKLRIKVNDNYHKTINLSGDKTAAEVAEAIEEEISELGATAFAGERDDFDIKGGVGKGTYQNAGRCLVDGYEAINESNLSYKFQVLYNNADVSEKWNVPELGPIEVPQGQRTDIAYLDVWERMVDSQEDNSLINEGIGLESCFRLKREWVVRIEPNVDENNYLDRIQTVPEHVYYPIAKLNWHPNQDTQLQIEDIRRKGLAILSDTLTINNGNVGIGTTDPGAKLDIDPTGADYWFRAGKGDDSGRVWITYGEQLAPKLVLSDYDDPPRIQFQQTGDLDNPDAETSPLFSSWIGHSSGLSSDISVMGGNVGIGTTEPETLLHISGNLKLDVGEGLEILGDSEYFSPNGDARIFRMIDKNGMGGEVDGGIAIEGYTEDDGARKPIMCVKGNGNVGIGTTDPTSLLDVYHDALRVRSDSDQYVQFVNNSASGGFITGHSRENNKKPLYIENLHDETGSAAGETEIKVRIGNENSPKTALTIREDSTVGIGITNPKNKLDVAGALVVGEDYAGEKIAMTNGLLMQGNIAIGDLDTRNNYKNLTIGTPYGAVVSGGVYSGGFGFVQNAVFGTNMLVDDSASIYAIEPSWYSGIRATNHQLEFHVGDNHDGGQMESINDPPNMTIKLNGKVGFGTPAPLGDLHVKAKTEKPLVIENCQNNVGPMDEIPNGSITIGAIVGDKLAIYWKDLEGKVYMSLLQGTHLP